jgi:SH3-like domain-containing protein
MNGINMTNVKKRAKTESMVVMEEEEIEPSGLKLPRFTNKNSFSMNVPPQSPIM